MQQKLTIDCRLVAGGRGRGDGHNVLMVLERRNVMHGAAATATKKDATAPSKENQFIKANVDTTQQ